MILLLQYTLIFASVLILVALGGCFAEHSGVINLGLEGIMIMGALGGALTMRYVPNTAPAIVMLLAVIVVSALVGMVYSCLLAVASINFKAAQAAADQYLASVKAATADMVQKTDEAQRQREAILQDAKQQADKIVQDAQAQAVPFGPEYRAGAGIF